MRSALLTGIAITALVLAACVAGPTPTSGGPPTVETVTVDSIDILMLESFPVQISVLIHGTLPDTCTVIDEVAQTRVGNTFNLRLITRSTQEDCPATDLLASFDQTVALDVVGLSAGRYTVDVHGVTGSFELAMDNTLDPQESGGDSGGNLVTDLAPISSVEVQVVATGNADTVNVTIRGYLPDGCTTLAGISEEVEGNTVRLTVETSRPRDAFCTQMITDFERAYTLRSVLAAGTYSLVVNDMVSVQFRIN